MWVLATELVYSRLVLPYPVRVTGSLLAQYALAFALLGLALGLVTLTLPRVGRAAPAAVVGAGLAVVMLALRLQDVSTSGLQPWRQLGLVVFVLTVAGATAWLARRRLAEETHRPASLVLLALSASALTLAARLLSDSPAVELRHPMVVALAVVGLSPLLLAATVPLLLHRGREARRAALAAWVVPAFAIALLAWSSPTRGTAPAPRAAPAGAAPPRERPPIVWLTVDTLRADRMGLYGHSVPNTPQLEALAKGATLYARPMSPSDCTRQSVPSLLSGLTPLRHGGISHSRRLPEAMRMLPERLQDAGYRTVAQSANHWVGPRYGLGQGFDEFRVYNTDNELFLYDLLKLAERVSPYDVARFSEYLPPYAYVSIDFLVNEAIEILRERDPEQPLFLYLQSMDPHGPYQPPARHLETIGFRPRREDFVGYFQLHDGTIVTPSQREAILARYDAEIAYTDAALGRLFAAMKELGLFDPALIVLTSDHGEHFQERGLWRHGNSLYAPLLDVPLVVKYPHQQEEAVVEVPVTTLDLVPTVLRELEEQCEGCDGRPLQDAGEAPLRPLLAYHMDDEEIRPVRASLLEGPWKLIRTEEGEELFNLDTDPGESLDLSARHPETAARLAHLLSEYEAAAGPSVEADSITLEPAEIERLKALGYLP
jgi:arylsulfatase A-like enzyme